MIGRLQGTLISTEATMALIDCAGVGYEVLLPDSVLVRIPSPGSEVTLLTRQIFREDGVTLYGFVDPFQRRLFDLLMSVKGCGPKIGLALIGQLGEETVANAIVGQDARQLARASGVGARLAERIILELKDKMAEENFQRKAVASIAKVTKKEPEDELVDALLALGYKRSEVDAVADKARESSENVEDQLKHALRSLQR